MSTKDHTQIGLDELSRLTIKDQELYWDKKRIRTQIDFSLGQKIFAGLFTFVVGVASVCAPAIAYIANLHTICPNTQNAMPLCPVQKTQEAAKSESVKSNTTAGEPPTNPSNSKQ
jgi:hypothetical protein